jgi:trehalose 6-phosphate synthase
LARLVIVSNRVALPRESLARAGGLAIALRDALKRRGGLWFGWSGKTIASPAPEPQLTEFGKVAYATVDLSPADYRDYYIGFANGMLWPLFHYRVGLSSFHRSAYEGYVRVNGQFAKQLSGLLGPDDVIWVHDYHFIPLAAELRKLGIRNRIGFFLHIPFPPLELLVALPVHRELVADLSCFDLVGLQTEDDVHALRRYVVEEAHGEIRNEPCFETMGGRRAIFASFPIGIDAVGFAHMAEEAAQAPETARLRDSLAGRALVIGVDRLDYSKGLVNRLEAFQELLTSRPEHKSRVTFMQIAPVSRGEIAQYRALRREIEGLAGRLNGKFSEFDWTPVRYLNKSFARHVLAGFYRASRVGLVTPLRDGMNLVAKEYIASQDPSDPGVLVLSRFAGAARELSDALIVNPHDIDAVAAALNTALTMPLEQRRERWAALMDVVSRNTVAAWRDRFLDALTEITREAA